MASKKMDIKAYSMAIAAMKRELFIEEKMMFDPNSERVKHRRRFKQKLKDVLMLCARMKLSAKHVRLNLIY